MTNETSLFLTLDSARLLLGISERSLYNILNKKLLTAVKLGARTVIKRADFEAYVNGLTEYKPVGPEFHTTKARLAKQAAE